MPYEMRALDVNFEVRQFVSPPRCYSDPKSRHSRIARPIIFSKHPNQRDNQAELCQLKKFCLPSKRDYVFRQFTPGNYVP
jgi:hypothetical protein